MQVVLSGQAVDARGVAYTRTEVITRCVAVGWSVRQSLTPGVDWLVASPDAIDKRTAKVDAALRGGFHVASYQDFFDRLTEAEWEMAHNPNATWSTCSRLEADMARRQRNLERERREAEAANVQFDPSPIPDGVVAPPTKTKRRFVGVVWSALGDADAFGFPGLDDRQYDFVRAWAVRMRFDVKYAVHNSGTRFRLDFIGPEPAWFDYRDLDDDGMTAEGLLELVETMRRHELDRRSGTRRRKML